MPRTKRGSVARRRKKILKLAKGYLVRKVSFSG
jgi:ribosomal protein L20